MSADYSQPQSKTPDTKDAKVDEPKDQYQTGFVVMLDILGFREYTKGKKAHEIVELWEDIEKIIDNAIKEAEKKLSDIDSGIQKVSSLLNLERKITLASISYNQFMFSDTIFLTVCSKSSDGFELLMATEVADLVRVVIIEILAEHKLLLRGAISFGEFFSMPGRRLVFGPALTEASQWYEAVDWAGVILAPRARYFIESIFNANNELFAFIKKEKGSPAKKQLMKLGVEKIILEIRQSFISYENIPFKKQYGKRTTYSLNLFPYRQISGQEFHFIISSLFSKMPQSPEIEAKYHNTYEFIKYGIKVYEKLELAKKEKKKEIDSLEQSIQSP